MSAIRSLPGLNRTWAEGADLVENDPERTFATLSRRRRYAKCLEFWQYKRVILWMEDLSAKLEKLLNEAEDCELIGKLASDLNKRALFKKLAVDLRAMAHDIQTVIAGRAPKL
jgi:hypothetical protein